MIPCPYCGTPNRRGSKYCSNCGQRLEAVSAITCRACERLNPPGSTYCAFCGALLSSGHPAAESAAGQYMPSSEETAAQEVESGKPAPRHELPSWLYEQPAMPSEAASQPPLVPQVAIVQKPAEGGSKYLQDIQGALPSTDAWLRMCMQRGMGILGLNTDGTGNKKTQNGKGCFTLVLIVLSGLVLLSLRSVLAEGGK